MKYVHDIIVNLKYLLKNVNKFTILFFKIPVKLNKINYKEKGYIFLLQYLNTLLQYLYSMLV